MLNAFHMSLTTASFVWSYLYFVRSTPTLSWSLALTTVYDDVYQYGYEKKHLYSYSIIPLLYQISPIYILCTLYCIP